MNKKREKKIEIIGMLLSLVLILLLFLEFRSHDAIRGTSQFDFLLSFAFLMPLDLIRKSDPFKPILLKETELSSQH